jgi:hypothetical protein
MVKFIHYFITSFLLSDSLHFLHVFNGFLASAFGNIKLMIDEIELTSRKIDFWVFFFFDFFAKKS